MRIPNMTVFNSHKNSINNETTAKKEQLKLRDALREIIDQKKISRLENDKINRLQENENMRFQTVLMESFENDQAHTMETHARNPTEKLNSTINPNHSISVKNLNQKYDDYVHIKMKDKNATEEQNHAFRERLKLQKMKEMQAYHRIQMSEKLTKKLSNNDLEKMQYKEYGSGDIDKIGSFDVQDKQNKLQKSKIARKQLDDHIRADQEFKNSAQGLDSKEFALNAGKIRKVIDKY
jgi:hypothetical protein